MFWVCPSRRSANETRTFEITLKAIPILVVLQERKCFVVVVVVDINDRTFVGAVAVVVAFRTFLLLVVVGEVVEDLVLVAFQSLLLLQQLEFFVTLEVFFIFCHFLVEIFFFCCRCRCSCRQFSKRTLAISRETFKFNKPKLWFSQNTSWIQQLLSLGDA